MKLRVAGVTLICEPTLARWIIASHAPVWSRETGVLLHRFSLAVPTLKLKIDAVLGLTCPSCEEIKRGRLIARNEAFEIRKVQSERNQLIAKCALNPRHSIHSLRRQFHAIQQLNFWTGDALHNSIPRAVSLLEDAGILLTTFIPGTPLTSLLRWRANAIAGSWSRIYFQRIGRSIGLWLRKFHVVTASASGMHDHERYMQQLGDNLSRCKNSGLSNGAQLRIRERSEQLSSAQALQPIRVAASHGEFLPQNILVHGTNVGVIDLETYSPAAPVTRDLATFLAYIKTLEGKGRYSRKALAELAASFLEAYGSNFSFPQLQLQMINVILEILYHRGVKELGSAEQHLVNTLDDILDGNVQ